MLSKNDRNSVFIVYRNSVVIFASNFEHYEMVTGKKSRGKCKNGNVRVISEFIVSFAGTYSKI